jgi:hypothetical protein
MTFYNNANRYTGQRTDHLSISLSIFSSMRSNRATICVITAELSVFVTYSRAISSRVLFSNMLMR